MIGAGNRIHVVVAGRVVRAIEPVSVSFAPSASPGDWSVSVMADEVEPPEPSRRQNGSRRFREDGR